MSNIKETNKAEKIELFQQLWYNRNPCHDFDEKGYDRFWETAALVAEEYVAAISKMNVTNDEQAEYVTSLVPEVGQYGEYYPVMLAKQVEGGILIEPAKP